MNEFILHFLCYFAIPLWMLAGVCDWACHRATGIETNSGWRESLIHSAMLIEMGIPMLLVLFFEINALIFLIAIVSLAIHEVTAMWDVTYAHKRRYLSPFEQHVHSFLEIMPILVLSMLATLHWQQFLALFERGPAIADFSLRWKSQPMPTFYLIIMLISAVLLQIIPYAEELWRCHKYRKRVT